MFRVAEVSFPAILQYAQIHKESNPQNQIVSFNLDGQPDSLCLQPGHLGLKSHTYTQFLFELEIQSLIFFYFSNLFFSFLYFLVWKKEEF